MFIFGIDVSAIDSTGKDILRNTNVTKDIISVKIFDDNGTSYMSNPVPLAALAVSSESIRFPGFIFIKERKYTCEISAQQAGVTDGIPTSVGSYPLNIKITFLANKFMDRADYSEILNEMNLNRG